MNQAGLMFGGAWQRMLRTVHGGMDLGFNMWIRYGQAEGSRPICAQPHRACCAVKGVDPSPRIITFTRMNSR